MARRSSRWVLIEHQDNTWELTRGNRSLYSGMRSEAEAIQRLRNHHQSGEIVMYQEPDGYRANITNSLRKRQIIE